MGLRRYSSNWNCILERGMTVSLSPGRSIMHKLCTKERGGCPGGHGAAGNSPDPSCCSHSSSSSPLTPQKGLFGGFPPSSCPGSTQSSACLSSRDFHTPGVVGYPSLSSPSTAQHQAQCLGNGGNCSITLGLEFEVTGWTLQGTSLLRM